MDETRSNLPDARHLQRTVQLQGADLLAEVDGLIADFRQKLGDILGIKQVATAVGASVAASGTLGALGAAALEGDLGDLDTWKDVGALALGATALGAAVGAAGWLFGSWKEERERKRTAQKLKDLAWRHAARVEHLKASGVLEDAVDATLASLRAVGQQPISNPSQRNHYKELLQQLQRLHLARFRLDALHEIVQVLCQGVSPNDDAALVEVKRFLEDSGSRIRSVHVLVDTLVTLRAELPAFRWGDGPVPVAAVGTLEVAHRLASQMGVPDVNPIFGSDWEEMVSTWHEHARRHGVPAADHLYRRILPAGLFRELRQEGMRLLHRDQARNRAIRVAIVVAEAVAVALLAAGAVKLALKLFGS